LSIGIEPVRAFVEDFVKAAAYSSFERTLPHHTNPPPQRSKVPRDFLVAFNVTFDLCSPKFAAGVRPFEQVAAMLMPKTAVGEQDCAP
jgi:hypothetical protein